MTCGFQWWKNSTCFFLMILVLLMSGSVLKEKTSIKILGMTFLLNWIGALTLSHLLLAATWKCLVSYKNGYIGLLVHHLLPVLNSRLMIEIKPVFSVDITVVNVHQNRLNLFPLSQRWSNCYSGRLHIYLSPFLDVMRTVYVNSFFPRIGRNWNSLPIECFPLTYDQNGFKSRIYGHLLSLGSF